MHSGTTVSYKTHRQVRSYDEFLEQHKLRAAAATSGVQQLAAREQHRQAGKQAALLQVLHTHPSVSALFMVLLCPSSETAQALCHIDIYSHVRQLMQHYDTGYLQTIHA